MPSYLIRTLRYSSGNIQKIGILATWPTHKNGPHYICSDITSSFAYDVSAKAEGGQYGELAIFQIF